MRKLALTQSQCLRAALITLDFPAVTSLVYEALTAIRKDCSHIGKKRSRN
jgi:hypothetical protein